MTHTYRIISPTRKETTYAIGQYARIPRNHIDGVVRKRKRILNSYHCQIVNAGCLIVLRMRIDVRGASGEPTIAGIKQTEVTGNNPDEKRIGHQIRHREQNALA